MKKKKILDRKTAVPALDRSIAILNKVSEATKPMTAAEITRELSLPRSSAHTLLGALVEQGLLYKNAEQRYVLGTHLMHWASGFLHQQDIVSAFQNEIVTLPELSQFSLTLSLLEGNEVIYIACRNSNERLGFTFQIGLRLPAAYSATGKALLSTLDTQKVAELFENHWQDALTPYSTANYETLLKRLEETRQRGFSIDDREIRDGMFCIGVAVFDHTNTARNGIALSMQKADATPETVERLGQQMCALAENLSRRLGATIHFS